MEGTSHAQIERKQDLMLEPFLALDLTDEKGFLCGKILTDLGAEVIKVEKPAGDPSRKAGPEPSRSRDRGGAKNQRPEPQGRGLDRPEPKRRGRRQPDPRASYESPLQRLEVHGQVLGAADRVRA